VNIKVHATLMKILLDLLKHHLHTQGTEVLLNFCWRSFYSIVLLLQDFRSDVVNVLPAVTIFWGWFIIGCCHQRAREAVKLATVIIEVVLTSYCRARGFKDAAQGVTDSRPTRTT